jgi:hypothetical protein
VLRLPGIPIAVDGAHRLIAQLAPRRPLSLTHHTLNGAPVDVTASSKKIEMT